MDPLARGLIVVGLIFLALGLLLTVGLPLPPLGRLPGDIHIERPGLRVVLPITSCLLLSVVVSAAFWLWSRLRGL